MRSTHSSTAFPLVIVGLNIVPAYVVAHLFEDFVESTSHMHLGTGLNLSCIALQPLSVDFLTLATCLLTLLWMYRNKVFIRI